MEVEKGRMERQESGTERLEGRTERQESRTVRQEEAPRCRMEAVTASIERQQEQLTRMSDQIFDRPELAFEERFASTLLEDYLEDCGFTVERGLGSLPTAFRATYSQGTGEPRIGLLCEYDALPGGHACGHQLQGPSVAGAAKAVKELCQAENYTLVVYGTPAEEGKGGKVLLMEEGFLKDMEVALMMHGGPATQTDIRSMAKISATVTYHGRSAHAALKPESGRSALDALLLAFQGIEFMREHVREDTRMHYTVVNAGGSCNVVPDRAVGEFGIRSYDSAYLDELVGRFEGVIKGAAMMTDTQAEIHYGQRIEGKIPAIRLNELLMEKAELAGAPDRKAPREKTGSTDFANVMHRIPGACIRVAFVPGGTSSHSQEYLDAGKSARAHEAVLYGGKILGAAVLDLVEQPEVLDQVKEDFRRNLGKNE